MTAIAAVERKPLAFEELPLLWRYLEEFPQHNFEDGGPASLSEFEQTLAERAKTERLVGFHQEGAFIGAAAYLPFTRRSGALHGVCFARKVHGSGVARQAVEGFLDAIAREGAEKISAQLHADNVRAWRFFKKMGFTQEGLFHAHATRGGVPVDLRIIALFPKKDRVN